MTRDELSERLWNFAARVGKLVDALPDSRLGRHVAGQLVRCGTSAPPNYDEGCNVESLADSVHKLRVALKELAETRGWLRFIPKAELLPHDKVAPLVDECEQLCRILGRSVSTAKYSSLANTPDSLGDEPVTNNQLPITNDQSLFVGLDHLAIAVLDTDEALKVWRDKFGFKVLFSEEVNGKTVRLTHLDLGNAHLQLVQPLSTDHPLRDWLSKNGPGLHHFCLKVDDVAAAAAAAPKRGLSTTGAAHQGTQGKRALFLDKSATQDVQVEITGK